MGKIYKSNRLEIPSENRTEGPTHITDILNRMLFMDYYEEIEADQVDPEREIIQKIGSNRTERRDSAPMIDKEKEAIFRIEEALKYCKRPVLFCSFGKDSIALLHMARRLCPKIEVAYLLISIPFFKHLYSFKAAVDMGVNLILYPPSRADYFQLGNVFKLSNLFYMNGVDWIGFRTGCYKYKEGQDYSCAIELLRTPMVSSYQFQWDCIIHGHKKSDFEDDPFDGGPKKPVELFLQGFGYTVYPLYDWTDDDAWEYVGKYNLPVQAARYKDNAGGTPTRTESDTNSNDAIPTCYHCLDYHNEGKAVFCPRRNAEIPYQGRTKEQNDKIKRDILLMH